MSGDTYGPGFSDLYRRIVPGAYRHPYSRRDLETVGPAQRRSRITFDDWAGALVVAIATGLIAAVVTLALVIAAPTEEARTTGASERRAEVVDVPVERVLVRLPDGREALGSFTLRMRAESAPLELQEIAGLPATPAVPDPWVNPQGPRRETSSETLVRERVEAAMTRLTYLETAGEGGKERLRAEIRDSVNEALEGAPVSEVYIRGFLVK